MKNKPQSLVSALVTASMVFASTAAHAQDARSLFEAGVRASRAGDAAGACSFFERSYALGPTVGAMLNVAGCEESRGELVAAYNDFATALAWAKRDGKADRAEVASARLAVIAPKIALVIVRNAGAARELQLDGHAAPELAEGIAVEPGPHTITGRTAAGAPWTVKKDATIGAIMAAVAPDAIEAAPRTTAAEVPPPTPPRSRPTWGYVALGVGAGALVAGGVTGTLALGASADARTNREAGRFDHAAERESDGRKFATIATVTGLAGAALAATGLVIVLSQPTANGMKPAGNNRQTQSRPGIVAAANAAGITLHGVF